MEVDLELPVVGGTDQVIFPVYGEPLGNFGIGMPSAGPAVRQRRNEPK